jgi:drug/metabolite transporter (DMT)-like permease
MFGLPKDRFRAYVFLLINAILWGFAGPIIKYSLGYSTPVIFLLYRYLIATVVFLPFFIVHLQKTNYHYNFKLIFLLALLGTPLTLLPLYFGLNLTTSLEASILVSTSPIFTVIGGLLFLKEIIKPKEWFGLSLAILGTLLLAIDPLLSGISGQPISSTLGNFMIIISNLVWTIFLLLSKKHKVDPVGLSFFSFLFSIPFFLITALLTHQNLSLNQAAIPGIVYMAIPGSIIAFWAYQEGQKRIEASEAAMFTYLQPLFGLPLSLLWLKEGFSPFSVLSTLIIVAGFYVSEKN